MPITHTFSSVIADDPEAASAGAVLPSHWNAPHDIDLAVSDIAGLQAELDAKQVQLLSGTNLKTVGGSSLLGSGDIALPNGVPVGGTTGQILAKNSATDFDTEWVADPSDGKEPAITAGTSAQYWRGDKSWSEFFADVRAATLTGLSTAADAVITATDTVLSALGKLQKQVSDNLSTLTSHTSNTSNPHSTTKAQVGLGNVDNTSDATKNAATATLTNKTLTTPVLSNPSFSGTTANMGTVTTIDINGGTADGMTMGASAALARVNTDRLETTRTAVTAPASTDGNIFSGTYTPSLTPVTNIGSSAAVACQYMRVGNVVSVSGHVYLGPAATGPTLIGVTLPVPSNFTIPSQLGGTFAASGVDENPGSIYADTANDLAVFDLQAKQTAVAAYTFHFTYVVL